MRVNILMGMLLVFSLLSCKDDKKGTGTENAATETAAENANVIQLANYSDENWSAGVGIKFNMFLADYSKETEELLKKGHSLVFEDGTIIPYASYQVADQFIQILVDQKASDFQDVAQYPKKVTIK